MTVDLYRRNDGAPDTLPERAFTKDGFSRTDLANQSASRADLGFVFFATIDPAHERAVQRKGEWVVEIIPAEPPPVVAGSVTMRQAKLALRNAKLLASADAAIVGMQGDAGEIARIEWQSATVLRRDHPLVAGIGTALGLNDAAIDKLFGEAAKIE